jgi:ferredoxin--NADP+ reductase
MAVKINTERWCEGRVHSLKQWTEKLFSIRVEADTLPFKAGQFTKLGLPFADEFVERPYSYVNAPQTSPHEFYFVTVPEGPLTNTMVTLKSGSPVWVMRRPSGFLVLDEVPDADYLWLMSTGTGIGPFLSILDSDDPWQRFQRIVLVHGVRLQEELSYRDRIDCIGDRHPGQFDYVPFVSRENADAAIRGRITAGLSDGRLESRVGLKLRPENCQVMLCGNPDMVSETGELLAQRGLARNRRRTPGHVTVENYW